MPQTATERLEWVRVQRGGAAWAAPPEYRVRATDHGTYTAEDLVGCRSSCRLSIAYPVEGEGPEGGGAGSVPNGRAAPRVPRAASCAGLRGDAPEDLRTRREGRWADGPAATRQAGAD